ncbi:MULTISPECIES: hypothetical protein [Methanobacterium]|uniref:Uncharacterized protein n=1 Tax=Methanobacterium veterum TaxID=408577 RepID=A0A9E4ZYB0_9EURY|nr:MULTISPECIES: hypothetical protein [Methanobacterium]MCZ3365439.1 hypothetical protein [Methanobacterium veterum]MCZ3373190.1 hypothetical protein [Methanobacterium veterum]
MSIFSLSFLILGIIFIILPSFALLEYKRKFPERKLENKSAFLMYPVGILYILGSITGYIWIIFPLTMIALLISLRLDIYYHKKKYSSSDSDI